MDNSCRKPCASTPNFCLLQNLLATIGAEKLLQTGYAKQLRLLKDSLQVSFCLQSYSLEDSKCIQQVQNPVVSQTIYAYSSCMSLPI